MSIAMDHGLGDGIEGSDMFSEMANSLGDGFEEGEGERDVAMAASLGATAEHGFPTAASSPMSSVGGVSLDAFESSNDAGKHAATALGVMGVEPPAQDLFHLLPPPPPPPPPKNQYQDSAAADGEPAGQRFDGAGGASAMIEGSVGDGIEVGGDQVGSLDPIDLSADSPEIQSQKMSRQGYLEVKYGVVIKTWQRRYLVLEQAMLTVYKQHTDVGVKFSKQFAVADWTAVRYAESNASLDTMEIQLQIGAECYTLRASSRQETRSWVQSLRYCRAVISKRELTQNKISCLLTGVQAREAAHIASESVHIEDIYEMGEVLGAGVAGTVYRAVHRQSREAVAIKVLSKRKSLHSARGKVTVGRELEILKVLSQEPHSHIVQLKAIIENVASIYIVMELVEGGELFQHVVSLGSYSEPDAAVVTRHLCNALLFLRSKGIVHRDLKPENILLRHPDDHLHIKLTDFGLSHLSKDTAAMDMLYSKCGTPMYMAPEVHLGLPYTAAVDVWAVGVILFILLSGTLPFYAENSQDFVGTVTTAQYEFPDEEWADVSDEALDLIERILVVDPADRIDLEGIMQHPWLLEHTRHLAGTSDT